MKENEKTKWWRSDYSLKEKIEFLKYRIKSPKQQAYNAVNNPIEPGKIKFSDKRSNFRITFLGDVMPINQLGIDICPKLKNMIDVSDVVVLNLEGIITDEKRFLALQHNKTILDKMEELFIGKAVINVANNHASDFGKSGFQHQNELLYKKGWRVFGYDGKYLSLKENFHLHSATYWSNQKIDTAHRFDYQTIPKPNKEDTKNIFNIFLPHWGYEMELFPRKEQMEFARRAIENGWDAIIGNHSHCPQTMQMSNGKPIAYSLGNFCYHNVNPNHWYGKIVQLGFWREKEKKPILNEIENYYTRQEFVENRVHISLTKDLNYRQARKQIRYNLSYFNDLIK